MERMGREGRMVTLKVEGDGLGIHVYWMIKSFKSVCGNSSYTIFAQWDNIAMIIKGI